MQTTTRSKAWSCLARIVAFGAGALVLSGCVADYAYVQPNVAGGGGYYTSDGPYSGQGYYDYYGTGPYYPGTSGWGYYNGADPYSNAFGWYDGYDGDYGYWPSFTFNVGISNVWNFPGYWGPWYSTGFPIRGCWHRGCGHRWQGRHHHWHDPVARSSPRPWLKADRAPIPTRLARSSERPFQESARPVEGSANRRRLPSATFAPHDFARTPIDRLGGERFMGISARPMVMPRVPAESEFARQRAMPMPVRQDFRALPQPVASPAPAPRVAPAGRPSPRGADAPRTRIP